MAYDHSKKIGNQGDVVKHAVLAAVLTHLSAQLDDKKVFSYVESHAAYPEYTLPDDQNAGWRSGIGTLANACGIDEWPNELRLYRNVCFGENIRLAELGQRGVDQITRKHDRYPGSSGIAFRILRSRAFRFELYDIDPSACHALSLFFPMWNRVAIRREDGIAALSQLESASLVVIDPPDLNNRENLLDAVRQLAERNITFIIWTPRNAGRFDDGWREGAPSTDFHGRTKEYKRLRVRWAEFNSRGMKGCQVTVSNGLANVAAPVVDRVRELMHWEK